MSAAGGESGQGISIRGVTKRYGSTIALLLTVVCLLVTLAVFRLSRRDLTEG